MDNKLNLAIYNRFKSGGYIAAELKATSEKRKRWIAIYKSKFEPIETNVPPHVFSVLDFELDIDKIDEFFSDEDMINKKRYYANTEEELLNMLRATNVDLSTFTYPWKCDYPL